MNRFLLSALVVLVVAGSEGARGQDDGLRIGPTTDDGIQIGHIDDGFPVYGVFIPQPGVPKDALLVNTSNASGEWALNSPDKIQVGGVISPLLSLVARVGGLAEIPPGTVVSVAGAERPLRGGVVPLATVEAAAGDGEGVVGVVEARLLLIEPPGKPGELTLRSDPGNAQPGDFLAVTVLGLAVVRVPPGVPIQAGQRLTADELWQGHARPLQSREIEGFTVAEGRPTVGIALEPSDGGKQTVLVFIQPR